MLDLPSIDASGGLTIDSEERIAFIFKNGRWDLPKGIIERNASAAETALCEVSEETGLLYNQLRVLTELIPTVHISKFAKTKSIKRTRWFLIRCSSKNPVFHPQVEEGIEHCEWVPLWDLERPLANCPARIQYLIRFWQKLRKEIEY